ncbi:MAG: 2-oxo acid dehydrogenase subunit E2 [Clostridiaceae bacterium]|nr:2-oxo acid dehydrogenase subunit E2 [Clostridia bacterium]MDD7293365.1 2-oxo acid dehydrogenase subunit E2 [Clostridiaceae bacterium]MDY5992259.1 2-oxo acid dehydrogenase subunit E2 [Oscillospiraceae bacterium]
MTTTNTEYFGIQRKIVANMTTESWQNIPHVTYMYEPDVTKFFKEYKKLNQNRSGDEKITFNTLMLKVITEGLKAAPVMNSHIEFDRKLVRGRIDTFSDINISMPTILPNGQMMTINLRDFGNKNLDEMTAYINDVRRRAEKTNLTEAMYSVSFDNTMKNLKKGRIFQTIGRLYGANFGKCKISHFRGKAKREYESIPETERLTIKDLEQGTVTVSNIGSTYLAQRGATALLEIVPPQVCALSVGAVLEKPLVVKKSDGRKEIEARNVLPICIAFDHRALDFGEIVPFMKRLDEIFENPSVIRSWVSDSNEKELFSVVA